jgi:hypothetical protein
MVIAGPKFDNKGGENLNFSKILRNRRKLIFLKRLKRNLPLNCSRTQISIANQL